MKIHQVKRTPSSLPQDLNPFFSSFGKKCCMQIYIFLKAYFKGFLEALKCPLDPILLTEAFSTNYFETSFIVQYLKFDKPTILVHGLMNFDKNYFLFFFSVTMLQHDIFDQVRYSSEPSSFEINPVHLCGLEAFHFW